MRHFGLMSGVLFVLVLGGSPAVAADIYWTGNVSGAWTDGQNWQGGAAPGLSDTAVFDDGTHWIGVASYEGHVTIDIAGMTLTNSANITLSNDISTRYTSIYIGSSGVNLGANTTLTLSTLPVTPEGYILNYLITTGNITGSGTMHFTGGGNELYGNNSYTGGTYLDGGILTGDTASLQGNIVLSHELSTLCFNQNISGNYNTGTISGNGSVIKSGPDSLTLSGNNTYSGGTSINDGVLRFSGNNNLGTGNLTFCGGTLQWAEGNTTDISSRQVYFYGGATLDTNGNNVTLTNSIGNNGYGGLTKAGSGNLTLSGNNSYYGSTTIRGGTLEVTCNGAIPINSVVNLDNENGVQLIVSGQDDVEIGGLSGGGTNGGNVVLQNGNGLLFNVTSDVTYAGQISGTGGLDIGGSGTQTLAGNNTYSGVTMIGGMLSVENLTDGGQSSGLGTSGSGAGNLVFLGGTLRYVGSGNATSNRLFTLGTEGGALDASGTGPLTFSNNGAIACVYTGNRSLTLSGTNSGSNTFTPSIGDNGAYPTSLTKSGSGTWVLAGNNTYSGGTGINSGILRFSANNNLGSGNLTFNGGTLQWGSADAGDISTRMVTFQSGEAVLDTNGYNVTLAQAIGNGGGGSLTKTGSGNLTLSGNNSYSGETRINGGTLEVSGGSAIPDGSLVTLNVGGVLLKLSANETIGGLGGGGTSGGNVDSQGYTLTCNTTQDGYWAPRYAGQISGSGTLVKTGSGTQILSGNNSYSGGTWIEEGTLQIDLYYGSTGGTLGSGNVTNDGRLVFNRYDEYTVSNNISGTGNLTQNYGTLTLTGNNTYSGGTYVIGGVLSGNTSSLRGNIVVSNYGSNVCFNQSSSGNYLGNVSGDGSLTKTGAGNLTLSGNNSYTYGTNINAGTLEASGGNAIPDVGTVTLADASGVLLKLSANETIGGLGGGGTSGGNVNLQGHTLTCNATDYADFTGQMIGSGTLVKNGTGIQILTGNNNTHNWETRIEAGTLQIGNGGTTGTLGSGSVVNNANLGFYRSDSFTVFNNISGTGNLTNGGFGTLTLAGNNTYSGNTTIVNGTLSVNSLADGGTSSNIGVSSSAASNLVLDYYSTLRYTGSTGSTNRLFTMGYKSTIEVTEESGPLMFSNNGAITFLYPNSSSQLTLTGNSSANNTFTPSIGDNGSYLTTLIKSGNGTWELAGNNTYSGGTDLNGGILRFSTLNNFGSGNLTFDGGTLQWCENYVGGDISSNRTVNIHSGGATLDTNGNNITVTNSIGNQGSGNLTKIGNGTLTLSGNNSSFDGSIIISGGTLQGDAASLQYRYTTNFNPDDPEAVYKQSNIINNAALVFNQTNFGYFSGNISGNGTLTKIGEGHLILSGNTTDFTGNTTISAGTLQGSTNSLRGNIINQASLVFDQSFSGNFTGNITGNGTLTKIGSSVLTLAGNNSYTGNTTISEGFLCIGSTTAFSSNTVLTIAYPAATALELNSFDTTIGSLVGGGTVYLDGATLTVGGNGLSTTYSGNISGNVVNGSGNLTKTGSGNLILAGNNTYTGDTVVSAGALWVGAHGALGGSSGMITLTDTGTGSGNVTLLINGPYAVSRNITVADNGTGGVTIGGNTSDNSIFSGNIVLNKALQLTSNTIGESQVVVSGVISGNGSLTKTGSGAVCLSGNNNYSGGITFQEGIVRFSTLNNLGSGNLTFNGGVLQWINGNTTDISTQLVSIGSGGATLDTNGNSVILANIIGNGGTGGLTKAGMGSLTLAGNNTYSGNTTIFTGTLILDYATNNGNKISTNGTLTMNGGMLQMQGNGTADTVQSVNGLILNSGGNAISVSRNGTRSATLHLGAISHNGDATINFTLPESGNITTTNNNNPDRGFLGGFATVEGTDWARNDGNGNIVRFEGYTFQNNVSNWATGNNVTNTAAFTGTLSSNLTIGSLRFDAGAETNNVTIANGQTLTIANGGGILATPNVGNYPSGIMGGNLTGANAELIIQQFNPYNGLTIGSNITGNITLIKSGEGTLTLSGNNTYAGGTRINGGTVAVTADKQLGQATGSLIFGGGTLKVNGIDYYYTLRNATLNTSGGTIGIEHADNYFEMVGVVTGNGTLTKTGSGVLALSGNNTYTGGTIVNEGTLQIFSFNSLGDHNAAVTLNDGILQASVWDIPTYTRHLIVGSGNGTVQFSDPFSYWNISGPGRLTLTGGGTYELSSFSNATTVADHTILLAQAPVPNLILQSGTLYVDHSMTMAGITLQNGTRNTIGTFDATGSGSGVVLEPGPISGNNVTMAIYSQGTTRLSSSNTYSGNTIVTGRVEIDNDSAFGVTGNRVTLNNGRLMVSGNVILHPSRTLHLESNLGGTIDVISSNNTCTILGNIQGPGRLTKIGGGTLSLGGYNTYTGGTTIAGGILRFFVNNNLGNGKLTFDGGTLQWAANNTVDISSGRSVTLSTGGAVLDTNGNGVTLANAIGNGGSGGLTKTGLGTLTLLSGNNTYTGGTTVSEGTLLVNNGTNGSGTGTGSIYVAGNGTLGGNGTIVLGNNQLFTANGTVAPGPGGGGIGTLTLNMSSGSMAIFNSTASFTFHLGSPGTGDLLKFVNFGNTNDLFFDDNNKINFSGNATPGTYTLFSFYSDDGITLTAGNVFNELTIDIGTGLESHAGSRLDFSQFGKINLIVSDAILTAINWVGGNNTVWTDANNWQNMNVPDNNLTNHIAQFSQSSYIHQPTINSDRSIAGIILTDDTADVEIIASGGTFAVGDYGIDIGQNKTLTFSGNKNVTINGEISGFGNITYDTSDTVTLNGYNTLSGNSTLNGGVLTLNRNNAFGSGNFVICGGTIQSGNGNRTIPNALGFNGNFTVGGTNAITFLGNATIATSMTITNNNASSDGVIFNGSIDTNGFCLTVSNNSACMMQLNGAISEFGGLSKSGNGTLILAGNNTYGGGTVIDGGILQGNTDSLQGDITNNAALVFDQTFDGTFQGTISSSGTLTKTGSGILTLTGYNSYTGNTIFQQGTIQFNNVNNFGTGNLTFDGGSLRWTANTTTDISTRVVTFAAGGARFDISGNTVIFTKAIGNGGSGGLTKTGNGTLTLSSNSNTYTGNTTINGGSLQMGTENALPGNTAVTINSTDANALDLSNNNTTIGSLAGFGTVFLGSATLTTGGNNQNSYYSGSISGTGSFIKTGNGTLTLGGNNIYTGNTTINAGTLQVGDHWSAGTLGSGNVTNDATLTFNRSDSYTVSNVISGNGTLNKLDIGTLILAATNSYTGNTTISAGTLQIGNGGTSGMLGSGNVTNDATLAFNRSDAYTVGNNISGTGGLFQIGSGNLTLTGNNSYSGNTTVIGGRLVLGSQNGIPDHTNLRVEGGGTFEWLSGNATTNEKTVATLSGNGALVLGISKKLWVGNGDSTFDGPISYYGGIGKNGTGTLTLTGNNTYLLGTFINSGKVSVAHDYNLGGFSGVVFNQGTLQITGTEYTTFNRPVVLNAGCNAVFEIADAGNTVTANGNFSGTGALAKSGPGTMILHGTINPPAMSNGITSVRVDAGTLGLNMQLTDGLPAFGGSVTLNGGTLRLMAEAEQFRSSAYLVLNGGAVEVPAGMSQQLSIPVSGNGALVKTGSGNLTLAGNNCYSGGTLISAGTLQIGNGGTSGTLGSGNVTNNGSLMFNRSDAYTVANTISGNGSLVKTGTGALTLTGNSSYSGNTVVSQGNLWVRGNVLNGQDGPLGHSTSVIQLGDAGIGADAMLLIDGNYTIGRDIAVASGSGLRRIGGGYNGIYSGNVAIPYNVGLQIGSWTAGTDAVTVSGNISGSGRLEKVSGGAAILSGSNSYSSYTYVYSGTLRLSGGSAIPDGSAVYVCNVGSAALDLNGSSETIGGLYGGGSLGGNVTLGSGTLTVNQTANLTYNGSISGPGSLVKSGNGTLTLGGNNTYTGPTTINGGTLQLASTGQLSSSTTVTINNQGILSLSGATTSVSQVVLNDSATLTGSGTFTGRLSGSANSTITATGNLTLGNAGQNDGFQHSGNLNVSTHVVTLGDSDYSELGSLTHMGNGTDGGTLVAAVTTPGFRLDANEQLTGRGHIVGDFKNNGSVLGDGSGANEKIIFDAPYVVSGNGTFQNFEVLGTFNPGNSPAITTVTDGTYWGDVNIELGGNVPGSGYDQLNDLGTTWLGSQATLNILSWNDYVPRIGDFYKIMTWQTGLLDKGTNHPTQFAHLTTDRWFTDHGVSFNLLYSNAGGEGYLALGVVETQVVPEPATLSLLAAGSLVLLKRRKKSRAAV